MLASRNMALNTILMLPPYKRMLGWELVQVSYLPI